MTNFYNKSLKLYHYKCYLKRDIIFKMIYRFPIKMSETKTNFDFKYREKVQPIDATIRKL